MSARRISACFASGTKDQAEMEKLVGQEIQCKIIKLDTANEDIVSTPRDSGNPKKRQRGKNGFRIDEGAVVRGTVRTLTDFGAFVDLGGVDGLLTSPTCLESRRKAGRCGFRRRSVEVRS